MSKPDLAALEEIWNKVQDHTLWQLQNCYMSLDPPDGPSTDDNQSTSTSDSDDAGTTQIPQIEHDASK